MAAQAGDVAQEREGNGDHAVLGRIPGHLLAHVLDCLGQVVEGTFDELHDVRQPDGDSWRDEGVRVVDRGVSTAVVIGGWRAVWSVGVLHHSPLYRSMGSGGVLQVLELLGTMAVAAR